MVKIKETNCNLCGNEKTNFAFIYYEKRIPICRGCIKFIKSLKKEEYVLSEDSE